MARYLSALKNWFVPAGVKPRSIKFGPFKGLKMNLDLRRHSQLWLGLSEREVFSYLRVFARGARTGIDIGAAEGEYTLFYLAQPHMKQAFAFDPSEKLAADLSANLALNGFADDGRAILIRKFVADHEDHEHCTLDSLAPDLEGPCVVKIDAEGSEGLVLQGAGKLLDRNDVSWLIETHSAELERECERILRLKGLTTTVIKNAWWRTFIPERRPIAHNRWLAAWRENTNGLEAYQTHTPTSPVSR